MRPEEFRDMLLAKPFVPFRLFLTDGSVFEIRHPDQAATTKSAVHLVMSAEDEAGAYARQIRCSMIQVTRIESIERNEAEQSV
jgi:hypothetical protein